MSRGMGKGYRQLWRWHYVINEENQSSAGWKYWEAASLKSPNLRRMSACNRGDTWSSIHQLVYAGWKKLCAYVCAHVRTLRWGVLKRRSSSCSSSSSAPFWSSSASWWLKSENDCFKHFKMFHLITKENTCSLVSCTYVLCQTGGAV